MFFKRMFQDNTRPSVKKVSQLVDKKSHKQKKYISLMVVPSYSTGKTRTLRIPRAVFYGVLIGILVVTAGFVGLRQQSNYLQRRTQVLEESLIATEEYFYEFRAYAEQIQDGLLEIAAQYQEERVLIEDLTRNALDQMQQDHRTELENIFDSVLGRVEEIEQMIREFDYDRQAVISGLSSRAAVIPPVAAILEQMEASQAALLRHSLIHNPQLHVQEEEGISLMSFGGSQNTAVTACTIQEYLQLLADELELQRELMESLESYRARMDIYLRNFPTLWPVIGEISSGFGWRRNPFGGGSEFHRGIDISAPRGTHIHAAGGGTVTFAGWRNGYGNTVIINHGNGMSTLYAHNTHNLVSEGQRVARGDVIAHVGSTGRSTGFHVHFEVQVNGVAVNPRQFMQEFHTSL